MSDRQRDSINGLTTVYQVWQKLKVSYDATEAIRKPAAKRLWEVLRADKYPTITDYDIALRYAVSEMKAAGSTELVTEALQISKTIDTLGTQYSTTADVILQDPKVQYL